MAKTKKIKRKASPPEDEQSFEESLAELESIVGELESGELRLGDALERYERGIGRLKRCHAELGRAARKIELLSGVDASGNPITVPFDDESTESLDAKKSRRSRRRSVPDSQENPSNQENIDDGGRLF